MVEEAKTKTDAEGFLDFVNASPSPYHAVSVASQMLEEAGFVKLSEQESWSAPLQKGRKFYTTRFGTSIIAFTLPEGRSSPDGKESVLGFNVIGAHTDSPCFKVKPVHQIKKGGFLQTGVETYGGGIWYTWFDRDLSVAGRLVVKKEGQEPSLMTKLVHIKRPIMRIPSLAIHLNREVNTNFHPNTETHTAPILATEIKQQLVDGTNGESKEGESPSVLLKILSQEVECEPSDIVDIDLYVFDTQPSAIGGALNEFMFSPRLDNQASCYTALQALIRATSVEEDPENPIAQMVCLFDHEEIGSRSAQGACSTFLTDVMERLNDAQSTQTDSFVRARANSFIVSADMAHAAHPNYPSVHEERHRPQLHKGVVIKTNQNQRYATNGYTGLLLREIARKRDIPLQEFVVPNNLPCGSTIGPIVAAETGIQTVDVGMPQLAMHSCREVCGTDDFKHSIDLFQAFFEVFAPVNKTLRAQFD